MSHLAAPPANATDAQLISFLDSWVGLLSQRRFADALAAVEAEPYWNAELLAEIIDRYGDAENNQVTLTNNGTAVDGAGKVSAFEQRKEIDWFAEERAEIWYDLNINGVVSDLTATFTVTKTAAQLTITLNDIHVM